MKRMTADPTTVESATAILLANQLAGHRLDKQKISRVAQELLSYHSKFSHSYELTWNSCVGSPNPTGDTIARVQDR